MVKRPGRTFVWLVGVAVVFMIIGVLVGRGVRSPAQKALDSQPPPKTQITALVERSATKGTVVGRATIAVGQSISIGPVTSSSPAAVITHVYVGVGKRVAAGARLIEVSGRPVYVLAGQFQGYRDLRVGDSGPDAQQLNAALNALKLGAPTSQTYTAQSASALSKLYQRDGYAPPDGQRFDRREVTFVPSVPATVSGMTVRVGASAGAANLVTLLSGATSVTASLTPDEAKTVRKGNTATIDLGGDTSPVQATVASVVVGASATDTQVQLTPAGSLPANSNGQDVKVTIEQTLATQGITVPVTAVYSQGNGNTVVLLASSDSSSSQVVPVRTGDVVAGMVMVTATDSAKPLKVGDAVVVSGP